MKINTLQSLINQQITQVGHGGQAGRLTETNPLTENSHQISTAEKAFANEVLEHVKNTALSRHDIACLLPRVSNLELKQGKAGEVIVTGFRTEQLSLSDAKLLLEAAMRQDTAADG